MMVKESLFVMVVWFFVVFFVVLNPLRHEIRSLKVDVALLQQQMIVLLVGQGYQLQEGK